MNAFNRVTSSGIATSLLSRAKSLPLPATFLVSGNVTVITNTSPTPEDSPFLSVSPQVDVSRVEQCTFAIGGHRGVGTNLAPRSQHGSHPLYRENTLRSLLSAIQRGATFVEFDVQVTSDGVPVLWHDNEVIYTSPLDGAPVYSKVAELSLEQFQSLVLIPAGPGSKQECSPAETSLLRRFEGWPRHAPSHDLTPWVVDADDELPTLDAIFQGLPEDVGLNLEIKMAVPDNVAITSPEEVQRMLKPILECIDRHAGPGSKRGIVFSCFDPDVCIALKAQQDKFPVLFLSGCGLYPHVDGRRTSIDAAIGTALDAGLAGIVVPAGVLLANKGMVAAARAANLAMLTYGYENSDPGHVRQQALLGVQAVISDEVEHVISQLKQPLLSAGIAAVMTTAVALATAASVALPPSAFAALGVGAEVDMGQEARMERVASSNPMSIEVL